MSDKQEVTSSPLEYVHRHLLHISHLLDKYGWIGSSINKARTARFYGAGPTFMLEEIIAWGYTAAIAGGSQCGVGRARRQGAQVHVVQATGGKLLHLSAVQAVHTQAEALVRGENQAALGRGGIAPDGGVVGRVARGGVPARFAHWAALHGSDGDTGEQGLLVHQPDGAHVQAVLARRGIPPLPETGDRGAPPLPASARSRTVLTVYRITPHTHALLENVQVAARRRGRGSPSMRRCRPGGVPGSGDWFCSSRCHSAR